MYVYVTLLRTSKYDIKQEGIISIMIIIELGQRHKYNGIKKQTKLIQAVSKRYPSGWIISIMHLVNFHRPKESQVKIIIIISSSLERRTFYQIGWMHP